MTSAYLPYLVLIPFALVLAFLLWVLWNLTHELTPRSPAESRRIIPIQTFAYRQGRQQDARILRLDSRS